MSAAEADQSGIPRDVLEADDHLSGSSDDNDEDGQPKKKSRSSRRANPGSSCEPCRKQHRACDGNRPCDRCTRNKRGDMCRYGIAPVSTRPRRKSKEAEEQVGAQPTTGMSNSISYVSSFEQPVAIPQTAMPQIQVIDTNQPTSSLEDERDKLHVELQTLAQVLDNLHQQLQPSTASSSSVPEAASPPKPSTPVATGSAPVLDPVFLRDSLWRPPPVPALYAAAGTKPTRGQIMTLVDSKDDDGTGASRGKKRKPVRKFYPRALKGTTVGYSESELANLQFAKDLLAYFGGDFNNVSVGQHAQCVVYKDYIVYVNREFIELMRSPYENIIGRSMDDFVPEAFLQYHNHMFHRELIASGSSTIAFETVMARLDRTCFKCVFGMSLMKNPYGKLVQKICTIYLNTIQEVEVPPGKTPVPYFEMDYARKVEYEEAPEPCKSSKETNDEARFPLYFAKACFEAKKIRESRLTARRDTHSEAAPS